ncbi:hypothetical protein [Thalassococcus sp. S3]|uniref:hypothetical protein n=1 Tax=Thalassococcus sp. S3 TaxID=2017482 RepID=UPI0015831D67|nr:hypothetical protein [Thalassococcus sp. S3]
MTDRHSQNQTRKPYMLGYAVRPIGDGTKSHWSKVAAAWAHKDGQGYEVRMDAMPVDGRLVLRTVPEEHPDTGEIIERTPDGLS